MCGYISDFYFYVIIFQHHETAFLNKWVNIQKKQKTNLDPILNGKDLTTFQNRVCDRKYIKFTLYFFLKKAI